MNKMRNIIVGLALGIYVLTGCVSGKDKEPISLDQIAYDAIADQKIDGLKISEIMNKLQKKGKADVVYYWDTEYEFEVLEVLCGEYRARIPFKGEYPHMINLYDDLIEGMKREGMPKEMWDMATMSAIVIIDGNENTIDFDTLKK